MSRVMIVDDEDTLLEMVATLVEDLGHQPIIATNGYDALERLRAERQLPVLLISDVMMPRMNGIALAQTIRNDPHLHAVPIVLTSAAGQPSGCHIADHFLPKPFDLDVLADLIDRYT